MGSIVKESVAVGGTTEQGTGWAVQGGNGGKRNRDESRDALSENWALHIMVMDCLYPEFPDYVDAAALQITHSGRAPSFPCQA